MTQQRINWTQIDTSNVPTGSTIDLGTETNKFNTVYDKNLHAESIILTETITLSSTLLTNFPVTITN